MCELNPILSLSVPMMFPRVEVSFFFAKCEPHFFIYDIILKLKIASKWLLLSWLLNIIHQQIELGLPGKVVNSSTRQGKYMNTVPENKEVLKER